MSGSQVVHFEQLGASSLFQALWDVVKSSHTWPSTPRGQQSKPGPERWLTLIQHQRVTSGTNTQVLCTCLHLSQSSKPLVTHIFQSPKQIYPKQPQIDPSLENTSNRVVQNGTTSATSRPPALWGSTWSSSLGRSRSSTGISMSKDILKPRVDGGFLGLKAMHRKNME